MGNAVVKVPVKYPAKLTGESPVVVDRNGGEVTIKLDEAWANNVGRQRVIELPGPTWDNALGNDGYYGILGGKFREKIDGVWQASTEQTLQQAAEEILGMPSNVFRQAAGVGKWWNINENILPADIGAFGVSGETMPDIGPSMTRGFAAGYRSFTLDRDDLNYPNGFASGVVAFTDFSAAGGTSYQYLLSDAIKIVCRGYPSISPRVANQVNMWWDPGTGGTTTRGSNPPLHIEGAWFKGRGILDDCTAVRVSNRRGATIERNFWTGWKLCLENYADRTGGSDAFKTQYNWTMRVPFSVNSWTTQQASLKVITDGVLGGGSLGPAQTAAAALLPAQPGLSAIVATNINFAADSGTASTLVLSPLPSLSTGIVICFTANATNTGAVTAHTYNVLRPQGVALQAGDIVAGIANAVYFDGTQLILLMPGVNRARYAVADIERVANDVWCRHNGPIVVGGQANDFEHHKDVLVDIQGIAIQVEGHDGTLVDGDGVSDNGMMRRIFFSGDAQRNTNRRKIIAISGSTYTLSSSVGEFLPGTDVDDYWTDKIAWIDLTATPTEDARYITNHVGATHEFTLDSAIAGAAIGDDLELSYCTPAMKSKFVFAEEVGTGIYYAAGQRCFVDHCRWERSRQAVVHPQATRYLIFNNAYNIVGQTRFVIQKRELITDRSYYFPIKGSSPAPGISAAIKANEFMQYLLLGRFDADNFGERAIATPFINATGTTLSSGQVFRISSNGVDALAPVAYTNGTSGHVRHAIVYGAGGETYADGQPVPGVIVGLVKVLVNGTGNIGDVVMSQNSVYDAVALAQSALTAPYSARCLGVMLVNKASSPSALALCAVGMFP